MLTGRQYATLFQALRGFPVPTDELRQIPEFEVDVAFIGMLVAEPVILTAEALSSQWRDGRIDSFAIRVEWDSGEIDVRCIANCAGAPLESTCSSTSHDIENCRAAVRARCPDSSPDAQLKFTRPPAIAKVPANG